MGRIILATVLGLSVITLITPTDNVVAQDKIRTSVTGSGRTSFEAVSSANRAARQVAPRGYSTISQNVNGSGTSWTATLVIEYRR